MYEPAPPMFGNQIQRERTWSGEGPLNAASAARTIYSTPASPYTSYQTQDVPRALQTASPFASTSAAPPCACPDCPPTSLYAPQQHQQRYIPDPYPRNVAYPTPSSHPTPSYGFQQPPEQPLYRPVARRSDPTTYFPAAVPTPVPSPPLIEDQLPDSFSYYQATWNQPPLPLPLPPPQPSATFPQRAPLYERPAFGFQPQVSTVGVNQPGPLPSVKAVLDRRRSSAEQQAEGAAAQVRVRTISAASTAISTTSEEADQHEATTPFMIKLHFLLSSPEFREFIRWNGEGNAFVFASNTQGLAEAFSKVFRHNSAHSFVRQLNIYDFKRMTSLELHAAVESAPFPGSELTSADFAGFSHSGFFRASPGNPCDLSKIKPKMGKKPSAKSLSAAKTAVAETTSARGRSLRSEGKMGGGIGSRKFSQ